VDQHTDAVGIGGTSGHTGKLVFQQGQNPPLAGKTELQRWTWYQLTFVRQGDQIRVYVNGELEIEGTAAVEFPANYGALFLGGRGDSVANWEGRLDEAAVFSRALSPQEIQTLR
jgi:hypothetical protein